MHSRMVAQTAQLMVSTGPSVVGASLLSAALLLLLGLVTAFGKAVRLLPQEKSEEAETPGPVRGARLLSYLREPAGLDRRVAMAQKLIGALYFLWGAFVTLPAILSLAGARSGAATVWSALGLSLLYFLIFLFSLEIPERVAGGKEGLFARRARFLLAPILFVAGGLDRAVSAGSRCLLRILRIREIEEPELAPTEEEFLQMLEAGHARGAIEDDNRELIANLFKFDDKIAGDVMTHRTEIEALPVEADLAETMSFLHNTRYTRFPIFKGSVDNVVGVLHVKDLLFYREQAGEDEAFSLSDIMRPAWFTPETRNISDLFREMQQNHTQMAIVIDEYGGTAGLLTIEDLVEQIVGNIEDEYDEAEQEMIEIAPDTWLVDGTYPIDKLARITGVPLGDDEYDTVAGLIIELLDRIPEEHERPVVRYGALTFYVLTISDNRIVRVRAVREDQEAGEADDQD